MRAPSPRPHRAAEEATADGDLVTFGLVPTGPSTAYGYIRPGAPTETGARRVASFVEKPDAELAGALIAEGCLWNAGHVQLQGALGA